MAEQKIDALMLTGGTSLVYFSGIQWGLSERLFAMVLPVKGEPFYRLPGVRGGPRARADRHGPARRHRPTCAPGRSTRARTSASRRACGSRHRRGPLGIEETVRFVFSDGVAQAAPALKIVERHAGHRRLPHGEGRARAGADAAGVAGHAQGLRGGVEGAEGRHDAATTSRTSSRWRTSGSASRAAPACRSASTRRCRTARSRRR